MSVFLRRSAGAAFVYAIATQGALADLTAADVWADWRAYMEGMGYEVSASEASSGNVTTISDLAMSMQIPEEDGSVAVTIPEMTLTENGDGTVSVGLPPSFPMVLDVDMGGEGTGKVAMTYAQQAFDMIVSGTPEDMTYDYSADEVTVELNSIEGDGEALPADAIKALIKMGGVTGNSRMLVGEKREVAQTMTAATLSYDLGFDDPESDEAVVFNGSLEGLDFSGNASLPKDANAADYQSLLDAGFAFDGRFTYAKGQSAAEGNPDGAPFAMSSSSQGGVFDIAMDENHIKYNVLGKDTKFSVSTSDFPFPLEMAMAAAGFSFDFPVQASDEAQPFALAMNLTEFTMSDMLWGLFDPAGALPRDPATVVLDTEGSAKVLVNFMDPAVAETLDATDAMPGELETFKINELLISMVGAKLTGTGEFEFDNSNVADFGDMPAPSGVANLELTGANALIDKLIAMGFVSDSDAMGARMMMGMLAVPGDAPDTLKSKIEITKDGQISANGQRLK